MNGGAADAVTDVPLSKKKQDMSVNRAAAESGDQSDESINDAAKAAADETTVNRRQLLNGSVGGAVAAGLTGTEASAAVSEKVATNGRIKQSVVFWCFNVGGEMWSLDRTCEITARLGGKSVEIVDPVDFATLKKHNLVCAMASNGMPGKPFVKGLNNPVYHEEVIERTKKVIDGCADAGFPGVIAFTGYRWRDAEDPNSGEIPLEEGMDNCVAGLKKLALYAEKKDVTVCLEHLNTRDASHPMKGHPGYQGDDVDQVAAMLRRVGSERVKLLFDIYHVQVMNGDVMRRIDQMQDIIGHVHTAGCPGRAELDDTQEVQFAPIMRKLLEVGYEGYVGQEFIPTRDPLTGLTEAMKLCDV